MDQPWNFLFQEVVGGAVKIGQMDDPNWRGPGGKLGGGDPRAGDLDPTTLDKVAVRQGAEDQGRPADSHASKQGDGIRQDGVKQIDEGCDPEKEPSPGRQR